jgi:hypothetical protein
MRLSLWLLVFAAAPAGGEGSFDSRCGAALDQAWGKLLPRTEHFISATMGEPHLPDSGYRAPRLGGFLTESTTGDGVKVEISVGPASARFLPGTQLDGGVPNFLFAGWRETHSGYDLTAPTARITSVELRRRSLSMEGRVHFSASRLAPARIDAIARIARAAVELCLEAAREELGEPACDGACCTFWTEAPRPILHDLSGTPRRDAECVERGDGGWP